MSPFFKGGFSLCGIKLLFDKEGKGRFSDETDMANNSANFWDRTLAAGSNLLTESPANWLHFHLRT
jgi:hypothetical protein